MVSAWICVIGYRTYHKTNFKISTDIKTKTELFSTKKDAEAWAESYLDSEDRERSFVTINYLKKDLSAFFPIDNID